MKKTFSAKFVQKDTPAPKGGKPATFTIKKTPQPRVNPRRVA